MRSRCWGRWNSVAPENRIFERRGRKDFAEDAEEYPKKLWNFFFTFSASSASPSRPLRSSAFFVFNQTAGCSDRPGSGVVTRFGVWMALAKATPVAGLDEDAQSLLRPLE
jgi:hypothetical protein